MAGTKADCVVLENGVSFAWMENAATGWISGIFDAWIESREPVRCLAGH
jgi:hypothetical protein